MIYDNSIFFSGAHEDFKNNKINLIDTNKVKSFDNQMGNHQKKKIDQQYQSPIELSNEKNQLKNAIKSISQV